MNETFQWSIRAVRQIKTSKANNFPTTWHFSMINKQCYPEGGGGGKRGNLPRAPVKGAPKFAKGGPPKGVIKKNYLERFFIPPGPPAPEFLCTALEIKLREEKDCVSHDFVAK
jgi:hypothetical protein